MPCGGGADLARRGRAPSGWIAALRRRRRRAGGGRRVGRGRAVGEGARGPEGGGSGPPIPGALEPQLFPPSSPLLSSLSLARSLAGWWRVGVEWNGSPSLPCSFLAGAVPVLSCAVVSPSSPPSCVCVWSGGEEGPRRLLDQGLAERGW